MDEEILGKILFIVAGMVGMFIIISLVLEFVKPNYFQERVKMQGDKQYVVSSIVNSIYECFEHNKGRKESVVCAQAVLDSAEEIFSSDIINGIDSTKVDRSMVRAEDLGFSGEIVIRYEDENIYVEKVEHERISS